MLRLPPTLITITAVELQDFCFRQKARLDAAQPNITSQAGLRLKQSSQSKRQNRYESGQVASENRVVDNEARHEPSDFHQGNSFVDHVGESINSSYDVYRPLDEFAQGADSQMQDAFEDLNEDHYNDLIHFRTESQGPVVNEPGAHNRSNRETRDAIGHGIERASDDDQSLNSDFSIGQENEPELFPVSQDSTRDISDYVGESQQQSHHASSSPSKHRFDYGGFVESLSHESSSFMPDDTSTPAPPAQADLQRLRVRLPLPRSRLHISELATRSPERKDADSLELAASSYKAPNRLLAQPPKRTPKIYRPRTISYSYEESERASAVYEDPQGNVSDNDDSQLDLRQSREQLSLHEELRGSSLHSASEKEDVPPSPPRGVIVHNHEANRTIYFSSPHLPGDLPPPFSSTPRRDSFAASVPSTTSQDGYKSDESAEMVDHSPSPRRRKNHLDKKEAPESGSRVNHRSTAALQRIGRILSGRYRDRSPVPSGTASTPTTPRQTIKDPSQSSQSSSVTPRHSIRVYDDSLPPTSQPQTPAHLPESRHRSRLHPSYTAPVTRQGRRAFHRSPHSSARVTGSASRIRRTGRSDSPLGMGGERGEGFRGLYGGQENVDDDVLFDHAARRLWDTGRSRSGERRSSDGTPERELTIAEIRRQQQ